MPFSEFMHLFEIAIHASICELYIILPLLLAQEKIVRQLFGPFARILALQLGQNANMYEAYICGLHKYKRCDAFS